jgi:hypothetical protein
VGSPRLVPEADVELGDLDKLGGNYPTFAEQIPFVRRRRGY